ncbi:MAG: hypothetical protein FWJ66_09365 [Caldibacillus sp.]
MIDKIAKEWVYCILIIVSLLISIVSSILSYTTRNSIKTIDEIEPEFGKLRLEDIKEIKMVFVSGARATTFDDEDLILKIYNILSDVVIVSSKRYKVPIGSGEYNITFITTDDKKIVISAGYENYYICSNHRLYKTNKNLRYLLTQVFAEAIERHGVHYP